MIGESRRDLLNWLNATLGLNYTKVEQCGSGAAYCQIFDSIHQDVPMQKVNFQASNEYQYITNFKILQAAFTRHKINKPILMEKLVKCRLQDNLEFLQWIKKYWMDHKDESNYIPETRRTTPVVAKRTLSSSSQERSRTPPVSRTPSATRQRVPSSSNAELVQCKKALAEANSQLDEFRASSEGLETERNFYFNKLREIEILAQTIIDDKPELSVDGILGQIQEILYSTEDGFRIPGMDEEVDDQNIDDETF